MNNKSLKSFLLLSVLVPTALYLVAGRQLSELFGFARASANVALDDLQRELPREVHDKKREQELATIRQELLDRQVQLTQSKNQISQLRKDLTLLADSLDRRQRLLSEAYPVLERATQEHLTKVTFANQEMPIAEFQRELDDLLARQEREEKQLTIKQQGLDRLQQSERQAEEALADMRRALDEAEQEVDILVARRSQAEVEAKTLEMAAAVSGNTRLGDEAVAGSVARLRDEVTGIESRNEARRLNAPAGTTTGSNRISRQWNRLEALKAIRDKQDDNRGETTERATVPQPTSAEVVSPSTESTTPTADTATTTLNGADVRIEIRGK